MTTPFGSPNLRTSRLGSFRTLAFATLACSALVNCSNSKSPSGTDDPNGPTGGTTNVNQGGGTTGGANGGGDVGGSGGSGGSSVVSVPPTVGQFTITVTPPTTGASANPGNTTVSGAVNDALTPPLYIWAAEGNQGTIDGCQILTPHTPVCEPACVDSICIDDGQCSPTPKKRNVGTLTITGLRSQGADATLTINPLNSTNFNYQMPPSFVPDYPPFDDGAAVHFEASGGDYAQFVLDTKGISPLVLTGPDPLPIASDIGEATLTWTPGQAGVARIQAEITFGVHGGAQSRIFCDVEDTGSLQVPSSLVKELTSLRTAGAPRATLIRSRIITTKIEPGDVALEVTSLATRLISLDGQITCNIDSDCPTGQTCQTNLVCSG